MIRIYPSTFNGILKAPAAGKHAQRLLFMAALASKQTVIRNIPESEDVDIAINCIRKLGATAKRSKDTCTVTPFSRNNPPTSVELNFSESSTCARISIGICSALGIKADCRASGNLYKRSFFNLTSRLALRGMRFTSFSLPFSMQGRLDPGEYVFTGDEGSQNISAMLIALPLLPDASTIRLESPLVDPSFVEITVHSLKSFGINIEKTPNGFYIPGRQYYQTPEDISTENDWSIASLWIAAGAAGGEGSGRVTVTDLPADSPQLYRNVSKELPLIMQDFTELDFDASDSPSLATYYAAMAAVKGASVTVKGVPQLRIKETDRLRTMKDICECMGQRAELLTDGIRILGSGKPEYEDNVVIDCKNDPWIFMSMALASAKLTKPIILKDEHCADKIYRDFLHDFETLGGKYELI